jgi:hypothetical protein
MSDRMEATRRSLKEIDLHWIIDSYFPSLSQEKAAALEQLHSPTNWGLTLTTSALLLVITRQAFPDSISLYILLVILLMGTHFFTRTVKGYINLLRFTFLQRAIAEAMIRDTTSGCVEHEHVSGLINLIDQYHVRWLLPLRRIEVFTKGLFELGYGYILGSVIVTLAYTVASVSMSRNEWVIAGVVLAAIVGEISLLLRSSYMRTVAPNERARSMR